MMVRILVQIGAALRAQSQAIRLAQRLQRQFLDQRVAQKRLEYRPEDPPSSSGYESSDSSSPAIMSTSSSLTPPLPFLPPLPDATLADLSSYGKNEVTFTVQSRLIGFRQRVHSACTGALMRALKIRPSTMESNEPTTVTSAPSSTPTISSPMPLGAGKRGVDLLALPRLARRPAPRKSAHGESSDTCHVQPSIQLSG